MGNAVSRRKWGFRGTLKLVRILRKQTLYNLNEKPAPSKTRTSSHVTRL